MFTHSRRWGLPNAYHWSMKKASGEFAGYPIQIAYLVEDYANRPKDALAEGWIVSTDLSLSSLFLREAAHLRWHIENNVFKRISYLAEAKRFYVKDPAKRPMVWEAKATAFWLPREGQLLGPYWLVMVRNVLDPREEKYFFSNASPGTPLEAILHVGFARWPVERCLQDEKSKLGLSDFEVRNYQSVCRHLLLTQVSHLFLARQTSRLRGEKSGDHVVPSPHGSQRIDRCPAAFSSRSAATTRTRCQGTATNPTKKRQGQALPYKNASPATTNA